MHQPSSTNNVTPVPVMNLFGNAVLREAVNRHRSGRIAEAAKLYRAILRLQPRLAPAQFLYGLLLSQTNMASAALPHLSLAVELDNRQPGYWLTYIETLLQAQQRATARDALARCLGAIPPCPALDALALKVNQPSQQSAQALIDLYREGNAFNAEIAARIFINEFREHHLGWDVLVEVMLANQYHDEAIALRRTYIGVAAGNRRARLMLGSTLLQINRFAEAVIELRLALAKTPGAPDILTMLAIAESKLGRVIQSENHYREALAHAPERVDTLCAFGTFLADAGRADEAEATYRLALSYAPSNAALNSNLAAVLQQSGRLAEALTVAELALKLGPTLAEAHCNLGHVYRDLGRSDEAQQCYRHALAINPALDEARNCISVVGPSANVG